MNTQPTTFMGMIAQTAADDSRSVTENGAIGHKTTGKALVDLNFGISSFRQKTKKDIEDAFLDAYAENPELALKYLFFSRDVRGGLGERRFFRVAASWLVGHHYDAFKKYLPLVPFYGRWDDLVELFFIKDATLDVEKIISDQLSSDWKNMKEEKNVSLLAKWLPSINTSSKETVAKAQELAKRLKMTERQYRKMLSALRKYIEVVETKMSANEWGEIDYEAVPTKANINYKDAFLKHDKERREKYLEALKNGEAKINASASFPHDIVHSYSSKCDTDATLEAMWKSLPTKTLKPMLVVADGSGSMSVSVDPNSRTTAREVANALAIYFAERLPGPFKNQYVTFSMNPQYVNLGANTTLCDKIRIAMKHNEVANTNIEAVFDMVLDTAKKNKLKQEDIPDILVISDMEFDGCVGTNADAKERNNWYSPMERPSKTLFQEIADRYKAEGYSLPRLIFWNTSSRTGTVPVRENDLGCMLVSGFSTGNVDMIMSNKLDPYEILVDKLNTARYNLDEQLEKVVL
jgi:hypothetical protein